MSDYMEVPCKYCKQMKIIALNSREYSTGLYVVGATCESCGKFQKVSNNPKLLNKESTQSHRMNKGESVNKTDDLYDLERWIKDSNVDGRGILFQFTDSDIPILRDCIRQKIKEAKIDQSNFDNSHLDLDSGDLFNINRLEEKDYALYMAYIIWKQHNEINEHMLIANSTNVLGDENKIAREFWDKHFAVHLCNIDTSEILMDVIKHYFPEWYQEKGKSIKQHFEEAESYIKTKLNDEAVFLLPTLKGLGIRKTRFI